jgi:phosphoribosylglycinamide formyltransferase-1
MTVPPWLALIGNPAFAGGMPATFISEPLTPDASFDPLAMSRGEPGLPAKFRWRKRELVVAEVLEVSRAYGDCKHGSGERYLRKHRFRVRTTEGAVLEIYFQRTLGKARAGARWWLQSIEEAGPAQAAALSPRQRGEEH